MDEVFCFAEGRLEVSMSGIDVRESTVQFLALVLCDQEVVASLEDR